MQFIMNEHAKSIRGEVSSFFDSLRSSSFADEDDLESFEDGHFLRRLQTDRTDRQRITFDSCLFEDSERGNTGDPIEQFGVITTEGVADDLVIKNSVFSSNQFGDPLDVVRSIFLSLHICGASPADSHVAGLVIIGKSQKGYLVNMKGPGHTLELTNNCFVNNNLIGKGAILVESQDILTSNTAGNFISKDDGLECQFVAVGLGDEVTCVEADAATCSLQDTSNAGPRTGTILSFLAAMPLWFVFAV